MAGCSGASNDESSAGIDELDPNTFVAPSFSGDADSPFCVAALRATAFRDPFASGLSPDETEERLADATRAMRDLADGAPSELDDDFDDLLDGLSGLAAALRAVAYDQDKLTVKETSAFDDPRFIIAQLRIDAYKTQVCL